MTFPVRTTFSLKNMLLLAGSLYYVQLLDYPFSGVSWFYDLTSRLHLNDVYLHLSHFYWTTLTYLGPFFLLQLSALILYLTPKRFWLIIIPALLYTTELVDFLEGNYLVGFTTLNYWDFNNLLTNNLNKYHPHMFYLSTIVCIACATLEPLHLYFQNFNFMTTHMSKTAERLLYASGSVNLFALFLGSWWAFQEGTWGGWWNWDPSEVLGLLVLTISLVSVHHFATNFQTLDLMLKIKLGMSFLVLAYFFTQLNFDLVSHNFGNRFTFFFTNTLFYLESALISGLFLGAVLLLSLKRTFVLKLLRSESFILKSQLLFSASLAYLWIWLILTSFLPLCNYFLWQYCHLNLLNISVNHQPTLFYLTLTLYLMFIPSTPITYVWITSLISLWFQTYAFTPLLLLSNLTRTTLLFHVAIMTQILTNLLTNQIDNMFGISSCLNSLNIMGGVVNHSTAIAYVCEDTWSEVCYLRPTSSPTPHLSYTLSTQSNINETNLFTLLQDSNSFVNYYQISNSYMESAVAIWNPYFTNVYETVLVSLISFALWLRKDHQLHP